MLADRRGETLGRGEVLTLGLGEFEALGRGEVAVDGRAAPIRAQQDESSNGAVPALAGRREIGILGTAAGLAVGAAGCGDSEGAASRSFSL